MNRQAICPWMVTVTTIIIRRLMQCQIMWIQNQIIMVPHMTRGLIQLTVVAQAYIRHRVVRHTLASRHFQLLLHPLFHWNPLCMNVLSHLHLLELRPHCFQVLLVLQLLCHHIILHFRKRSPCHVISPIYICHLALLLRYSFNSLWDLFMFFTLQSVIKWLTR